MGHPVDVQPYLGLSTAEAHARADREGLRLRVLAPGAIITMEYIENRINVTVVDDLVVRATHG